MTFAAFVATIIIVLFLVTIVIAVGSYVAYKLRERRKPQAASGERQAPSAGFFFERVDAAALGTGADRGRDRT